MTPISVTHDHREALKLADRIAVLQDGEILCQVAEPETIFTSTHVQTCSRLVLEVALMF